GILGSGLFLIPYNLQFSGINSFFGLFLVFLLSTFIGYLMTKINGSVFEFIESQLGKHIGVSLAWVYWFVSWSSVIISINELFRYVSSTFKFLNDYGLIFQISIVILYIVFNIRKKENITKFENIIDFIKIFILILIPMICVILGNFSFENLNSKIDLSKTVVTFPKFMWCFVGLEIGSIMPKNKDTQKTVILALFLVFTIYAINLISIFGVLGYKINSYTCYSELAFKLFGNFGKDILNLIISFIILISINVLLITTSQMANDHVKLGNFPKIFNKNKTCSIIFSSIGLVPLCFFSSTTIVQDGLNIASNIFLLFYSLFWLSFFKKNRTFLSFFSTVICFSLLFINL
ncbi:MAG: amino acid permease, partial [Bacteroidota bacterium]